MILDELVASIEASAIAFVVTDARQADNPIVAVNPVFCELTQYVPEELIGRNPRLLQGELSEEPARTVIREAVVRGRPGVAQMTNYRKDGSAFVNAMMVAPVFDGSASPVFFIGSQVDLGSRPLPASEARRRRALEAVSALSPRQAQVLLELVRGYRGAEVAARLGLRPATVKMHRSLMLKRLGVKGVAEAVRLAVEAGIPL